MDIERIIRDLIAERDRVSEIIAVLERLNGQDDSSATKRRGRRFMDNSGRKEVSERMKRYWATRRKEQNPETAGAPGGAKPSAGKAKSAKPDGASDMSSHQAAA